MTTKKTPLLRYDVTTALTLIFPNTPFINETRSNYDGAYQRWMPHINFLFPFVESVHLEDMKNKLLKAFHNQKSFKLDLSNLNSFSQKKRVTFHLKPSDQLELQQLYTIIRKTLPEVYVKHSVFEPHLTLGQCPKQDYPKLKKELEEKMTKEQFEFNVDGIYIIQRSNEDKSVPFKIVHKIPFSA